MVETVETGFGPIEVARVGSGPPVLLIHGTPGGSDSSVAMGRFLVDAGFELIAPSRPGYLGTPLAERRSIDDQAELLEALLDRLGHGRFGLLTWSGGGPSGYRLAARHPDRVSALVAFAAVSQRYPQPAEGLDERLLMKTDAGNWLLRFLASHAPETMVAETLKAEGELSKDELKSLVAGVLGDDRKLDVVLTMANVVGDYAHRRAGVENDWDRFGEIESLELEKVEARTLVITGSADIDVPPTHSEYAAATIPGAEHLVMDRGTHLSLFVHPDCATAQARAVATLRPPRPEGHVQLARRMVEWFNARDPEAAQAHSTDDVEVVPLRAAMEGTSYRGPGAYEAFMAAADESWDELRFEVDDVRESGRRVVVIGRLTGRARLTGAEVGTRLGMLYEFEGDRVSGVRTYADVDEALKAAGRG